MGGAGGVGQGTERVENGARAELTPGLGGVFHGRMVRGSKEEGDPRGVEDLALARSGDVDGNAEGFDDVGAAATARHGAVAVLGHGDAAPCHDHGRCAGQVQRVRPVTPCSAGIHDDGERMFDRCHRRPHGLRRGDDGLCGLAAHPKRDRERRHLHRRPRAREDRLERLLHVLRDDPLGPQQTPEDRREFDVRARTGVGRHDAPPRRFTQFPTSRLPSVVRILSGWN